MSYEAALTANDRFVQKHGMGNAHLAWTLALYLEEADVEALASQCLVDGKNDKKIDFIHLDLDTRRLVFAQGYYATKRADAAPANKASDLNTAAAWLLSGDLKDVPEPLRDVMFEARQALTESEIETIELLYVHNLPESVNVTRELQTAQEHLQKTIATLANVSVSARELGASRIENLFLAQDSRIAIKDTIVCPAKIGFTERGDSWEAHILSVPGSWLHQLFTQHGELLFSANYRGFLGITKRRKINNGIRSSAESRPQDFWVFNNGITLLTLGVTPKSDSIHLTGIAIINGAQTTGSIGSVETSKHSLKDVKVLCRVIKCTNPETIDAIVRYNNTQNEITTWDQYSNDSEQARIEREFAELGHQYSRKRGFQGKLDQLCLEEVAQPVVSFGGRFAEANRGKNRIFERKQTYSSAFAGKKARHILFAYTLARAVDERRTDLKNRSTAGTLIALEEQQLRLLRHLTFKYFFIHLVARCLEAAFGTKVDLENVGFTPVAAKADKNTIIDLVAAWSPLVEKLLAFAVSQIGKTELSEIMRDESKTNQLIEQIQALVYTTRDSIKSLPLVNMVTPD